MHIRTEKTGVLGYYQIKYLIIYVHLVFLINNNNSVTLKRDANQKSRSRLHRHMKVKYSKYRSACCHVCVCVATGHMTIWALCHVIAVKPGTSVENTDLHRPIWEKQLPTHVSTFPVYYTICISYVVDLLVVTILKKKKKTIKRKQLQNCKTIMKQKQLNKQKIICNIIFF